MSCANAPAALEAYADGELDVERDAAVIAEIADHLVSCAACRATVSSTRQFSVLLRTHLPQYDASDVLRARVSALTATAAPQATAAVTATSGRRNNGVRAWRAFALAASVMFAVVFTHDVMTSNRATDDGRAMNRQLIDAHVRSLMLDHLVDVPSSDRHTVKPWFEGKVNFSPSVFDFAADSFPLAGGRLDYATGHATAAIVFHRGQHAINLFVWPADSTDADIRVDSQEGYNIASWRRNHLRYAAVSTLNRNSLAQFAALYVARDSATDAVQR